MDTNKNPMLFLDNQLCFALYASAREVTKLYRPFLDELGLTYTQYVTLLVLWEKDELPVKSLGEKLYLDSGTLTPLLKKLEAAGHVRRDRDPQDERSVIVRLTEQGHALREKVEGLPAKVFCQTDMPPEEIEKLRDQLQDLTRTINKYAACKP
ncbi:DNA-binding MarR family transcriptional regulator [Paenibacillus phyllosphaerae]|uniref:DNA-binding MarR family transcriptional regulator n=1 Tax=Paenibacillus phyllosphaerae TaxID=274593 RepID=A0A7W5AY70_9BACL|nr:MarR family transcriptional regulator [Paenibacillus phyllosphaerae]MBB3110664.1 DNA-binding MarR family transcriptional regulator [Paenibacillus phyllosphaerae]